MFARKLIPLAVGALVLGASAQAATVSFFTEASFLTAAGGGLAFESFETATTPTTTSVAFTGGTFSCAGGSFCPGFFGISTFTAVTGVQSVRFASPDTATFTFGSAITAFGIHIGGAGDVAPITLTALLSNGDSATALSAYSDPDSGFTGNDKYFGVISDTAFTSITFSPSNSGDGIFFDSMSYGTAATAVPEPGTMVLTALGLAGLLGSLGSRRRASTVRLAHSA